MIKDCIIVLTLILIIVIIMLGVVAIPVYIGSCKKAEIYNRLNNTNYTCSDFFWAADQIQSQTIKLTK